MTGKTTNKPSLPKRLAVFLLLALVTIVSFTATFYLLRFFFGSAPETDDSSEATGTLAHIIVMFVSGNVFLAAGVFAYVLALLTQCFTFNYHKPFWNAFRIKIYVTNIIVVLCIVLAAAAFASPPLTPVLTMLGLPWMISFVIPPLAMLVLVQLLFVWLNIWVPLEKTIVRKRLAACGISHEDMDTGIYAGVSDPAKSSFRKFTTVEEDVGMLWIQADELLYRGDSDSFRIGRHQLIEIERAADPGSIAAYAGTVHTILRFRTDDGTERRTRLHTLGCWTLGGAAKASDGLANRLVSWQKAPPASGSVKTE